QERVRVKLRVLLARCAVAEGRGYQPRALEVLAVASAPGEDGLVFKDFERMVDRAILRDLDGRARVGIGHRPHDADAFGCAESAVPACSALRVARVLGELGAGSIEAVGQSSELRGSDISPGLEAKGCAA